MRSNIHNVRQAVAALRVALLSPSPEGIASQLPALQEAAVTLERLERERQARDAEAPHAGLRDELEALATELRAPAKLIAQGLAFVRGMSRLLAPPTADYQPDGEPVPLKPPSSLLVRG